MSGRPRALAPRRENRSERFFWPVPQADGGHPYSLTVGFRGSGSIGEIFLSGPKYGSDLHGLIDDACVSVSMALQMGLPLSALARVLGRHGAGKDTRAASVLGEALRRAVAIEAEDGGAVATLARALRGARQATKAFE